MWMGGETCAHFANRLSNYTLANFTLPSSLTIQYALEWRECPTASRTTWLKLDQLSLHAVQPPNCAHRQQAPSSPPTRYSPASTSPNIPSPTATPSCRTNPSFAAPARSSTIPPWRGGCPQGPPRPPGRLRKMDTTSITAPLPSPRRTVSTSQTVTRVPLESRSLRHTS